MTGIQKLLIVCIFTLYVSIVMTVGSTIVAWFHHQVVQHPQHVAIQDSNETLTYQQVHERSNQIAHFLIKKGMVANQTVALCLPRSATFLVAALGVMKAGGGYVPLDPKHPSDRLHGILQDLNPFLMIILDACTEAFVQHQHQLLTLSQLHTACKNQAIANVAVSPSQLAYIIYTSGSTGQPKGVLIEHGSVVNYARWVAKYANLSSRTRVDFSANHSFDLAVTVSIVPLMCGATVIIAPDHVKENISAYLTHLQTHEIHLIKLTPSYFKLLLYDTQQHAMALPHLRTLILGGEALSLPDCKAWLARYPHQRIHNEYGPTEATVAATQFTVTAENVKRLTKKIPIGKPGPHMSCVILGRELYIGGKGLARGYLNKPEQTAERFITHPVYGRLYKTGDLCRTLPDGQLDYIGREDTQVKIRGFRVELTEIEQCLRTLPEMKEVVVLFKKVRADQHLIAYCQFHDETKRDFQELSATLQNKLPHYMIPSYFIQVNHFALTANGKLDLKALPIPTYASKPIPTPTTPLEEQLITIWSEELGLSRIGIADHFFELGGDSLSAARIISKMNHHFKKNMMPHDVYYAPTIAQFLTVLSSAPDQETQAIPVDVQHTFPLSDFQLMLWLSILFAPHINYLNIVSRKRIQGPLNVAAFRYAVERLQTTHQALSYRLHWHVPMQTYQEKIRIQFNEVFLDKQSETSDELALQHSFQALSNYKHWASSQTNLLIRLFYLKTHAIECQICLPHFVADNDVPDLIFSDLSRHYQAALKNEESSLSKPTQLSYAHYVRQEWRDMEQHDQKCRLFWANYFADTTFFAFPKEQVAQQPLQQYSTYCEISSKNLLKLKQFCTHHHVSVQEGLCALLGLALSTYSMHPTAPVLVTQVKSTRTHPHLDKTMGCFLKVESIKLYLSNQKTLKALAHQVHQANLDTAPYQCCSALVKWSHLTQHNRTFSEIAYYFLSSILSLYIFIFRLPVFYRRLLSDAILIRPLPRDHRFLIHLNVHRNFLTASKKTEKWLGQLEQEIPEFFPDLSQLDQVFEASFLRKHHRPYFVISANLKPSFRQAIATNLLTILDNLQEPYEA